MLVKVNLILCPIFLWRTTEIHSILLIRSIVDSKVLQVLLVRTFKQYCNTYFIPLMLRGAAYYQFEQFSLIINNSSILKSNNRERNLFSYLQIVFSFNLLLMNIREKVIWNAKLILLCYVYLIVYRCCMSNCLYQEEWILTWLVTRN